RPRICAHVRVAGAACNELDVLADHAPEQTLHVVHHGGGIHHAELHHLLPSEGEQLTREARGALDRSTNLFRVRTGRMVARQVIQDEPGVALDCGEQVVEVVCDSTCQATHGLHALRLPELFLEYAPRAHVTYYGRYSNGGAGRVRQRGEGDCNRNSGAVAVNPFTFQVRNRLTRIRPCEQSGFLGASLLGYQLQHGGSHDLAVRITEHALRAAIPRDDRGVCIHGNNGVV